MRWHLAIILALAAILNFWQLGRADIVTDEASHATRAIGLVDFDFGIEQPTPWQWIDTQPPWWMHLSFHDHPVMLFLAQHLSIRAFGETPFAARLPSALAGIAAVIFVYLIGKQLYSPGVGAIGALLFAISVNHVWISRIGLFESLMLAFMLASTYCFLRAVRIASVPIGHPIGTEVRTGDAMDGRWLIAAGVLLGFAFLTKYTSLILVPIFLTILLGRRRDLLRTKYFLFSIFLFLAIASPVIIYNIQLYRTFGHFDFQFSLLLGQDVEAWQARPGQEVLGSYAERIQNFTPFLIQSNSPYFLILSALGFATIVWQLIRRRTSLVIGYWLLIIVLAWLLPFLLFTGPAPRFLTMLTPWLAIAAGYGIAVLFKRIHRPAAKKLAFAAFAAFVAFETFYSYNSVIALDPVGSRPWAHSSLHRQAGSWGFNELNAYLDHDLKGKMPDPAVTFEFPFAREILDEARAEGLSRGLEPVPVGIVYNDNINLASQLWVFLRRITYQGWPVVSAENFRRGGAAEFLRQSGVEKIYFINATEHALQDRTLPPTPDGDILEAELRTTGAKPIEIKNPRGEVAFRVYQFELR